jgi:hypothetical protein
MKYYAGKTILITGSYGGFGRHFISIREELIQ